MNRTGRTRKRAKKAVVYLFVPLAATLAACREDRIQSVLDPRSTQAAEIALLWWVMLAVGTLVMLGVMVLLAMAVVRRSGREKQISDRAKWRMVIVGGVALPLIVVFALTVYSTFVGSYVADIPDTAPITIEVTGERWWWNVQYSTDTGLGARTANEIHIPVGVPVKFVLRSQDVIHSFWMPNFQGKTDLIPGRTNYTWVTATEPGVYRGQCAEFCGLQHAKMGFIVVAESVPEFYAWLQHQARPARQPETAQQQRGQEVFLSSSCVLCHTIDGTTARATVGPDLTHVASRKTLAAGILPNNRGHMGGWVANPQTVKPGALMPTMFIGNTELTALIAYLESLE